MEPIRDPSIDSLKWAGWTMARHGPPPHGTLCDLRVKDLTRGGLSPMVGIVELHGRYDTTAGGWVNERGELFLDGRELIAWRPVQRGWRPTGAEG